MSLFWTLALLAGERSLRSPRLLRAMAVAGAVWSLALLTKIHAWFLMPILLAWAFFYYSPATRRGGRHSMGICRDPLVLARLALALVRTLDQTHGLLGHRRGAAHHFIWVQYFGQVVADATCPGITLVYFGKTALIVASGA